jgi:hypothetical protein
MRGPTKPGIALAAMVVILAALAGGLLLPSPDAPPTHHLSGGLDEGRTVTVPMPSATARPSGPRRPRRSQTGHRAARPRVSSGASESAPRRP